MKKLITSTFAIALVSSLYAQEATYNKIWHLTNCDSNTGWFATTTESTSNGVLSWKCYEPVYDATTGTYTYTKVVTSEVPNGATDAVYFYHSQGGVAIDGDATVSSLSTNGDMALSKGGSIFVEMRETWADLNTSEIKNGSLTLDGSKYFNFPEGFTPSSFNIGPLLSTDKYYTALNFRISAKNAPSGGEAFESRKIIFNDGVVNVKDSLNRQTVFSLTKDGNSDVEHSINFQGGNVLNVDNDLILLGGRGTSGTVRDVTTTFNFNNTTNIGTYDEDTKKWTHKDVYVGTYESPVYNNPNDVANAMNIGYDSEKNAASFNANNIYLRTKSVLSVKDGGSLNLAGGILINYKENGGNWDSAYKGTSALNIEKGAFVKTKFLRGYHYANLKIDSKVDVFGSNSGASIYIAQGAIEFGANAEVTTTTGYIEFGGLLTVNSGTGKIKLGTNQIKLLGSKVIDGYERMTVVLNTENPFHYEDENGNEVKVYFFTNATDTAYDIKINANQSLDSFRFSKGTNKNMSYNLIFDDSVTSFNLNTFTNGTWVNEIEVSEDNGAITYLQAYYNKIVISGFNFKNGVFHIDNWSDDDLITDDAGNRLFTLDDANYTDLKVVSDGNGGAYLTATYIPEPSTYAILAGILALGIALYRKNK